MADCCDNCRFLHELKWLRNKIWHYMDVCTVFPQTEDTGYDAFCLVIENKKQDVCEMYDPKPRKGEHND